MPYIYIPKANEDFKTKIGAKLNSLFPTSFWTANVCQEKNGNCYMEKTCDEVRGEEAPDASFKITITDSVGTNMDLEIPKD